MANPGIHGKITRIVQQKRQKNRYNIYLDDTYAFSVHEDVFVKHRLFKGMEVDATKLQALMQDEELQLAYHHAIRMLSFKPRTEKEIRMKLSEKQFTEEIIAQTMDKLKQQQYINDEEYAHMLTKHRSITQKKGRQWIIQELKHKGIQQRYIDQALEQIDESTEFQNAYEIGQKKWWKEQGPLADKIRRTGGFLMRRGYSSSLVHQVLRRLQEEQDE